MDSSLPILLIVAISFEHCYEKSVNAFSFYANEIPNGLNVTHPCVSNALWVGVGHISDAGGGSRNQFGIDFDEAGFKWTKELCRKDSDKDGMTNGEELGDPNCVWVPGSIPYRTSGITHPGVCNPCGSATCNVTNSMFGSELYVRPGFNCPAAQGASTRDYRMALTQVPAEETTYICQAFEISTNETLYMVANEPVVNNSNVLHHMLAFGCATKPAAAKFTNPYSCFMNDNECGKLLAVWGFGIKGECLDSNIYVSVGKGSFPYMIIQLHWNNPFRQSNWWDNSGFRFHYITTPRMSEAAMMIIGQQYLELPPGMIRINATSNCASNYSRMILKYAKMASFNVTAALPHMHMRGRYASIEQYRDGVKVDDLVPYQESLYTEPKFLQFLPKEVKAGDELRMVCTFSTIGGNTTGYFGESTSDEMCLGFIRYYPKLPIPDDTCVNYGPYTINNMVIPSLLSSVIEGCNITAFTTAVYSQYITKLQTFCSLDVQACQPACKAIVQTLLQEPCMQGWPRKFMLFLSKFGVAFQTVVYLLTLFSSQCEMELHSANQTATALIPNNNNNNGFSTEAQLALLIASSVVAFAVLLIVSVVAFIKGFFFSTLSATQSNSLDVSLNTFVRNEDSKCEVGASDNNSPQEFIQ